MVTSQGTLPLSDTAVRRNDFDVTNTVQVSSTRAVQLAIEELCLETWPEFPFEPLRSAFDYFDRLFAGDVPGFFGLDTVYHDRQHTLDVTLALARLLAGYERQQPSARKMGAERACVGLIIGLFHDMGYLRRADDSGCKHGAELTRIHVTRGADFLADYLPTLELSGWAPVARQIIHYTGYEVPFQNILVADPLDVKLGHLIGTADMIAQMADRCYLEKCRDRLYPEFVLGGMALPLTSNGNRQVRYASGLDVLRQTPEFVAEVLDKRLDVAFGQSYRHIEMLYDGRNPYMEMIDRNISHLRQILRSETWRLLRRNPPIFSALADPMGTVRGLMVGYIRQAWTNHP